MNLINKTKRNSQQIKKTVTDIGLEQSKIHADILILNQ